ncbi:purine-cytosine permease family protein [Streptomyces sp. NPDC014733]|uniref:purine-cytosine permease family protein n=1 Tax=Streptomyces sp. NPDC014733 TaxID=3364885 RepID=UPI0036FA4A19
MTTPRNERIEQHSIDYVPVTERHGKPWHLFTVWFSSNLQITGFVNGALAVLIGLDLPWAIFAIIAGNLVGALFMAYHSVQGPRMGVPQMIQSRAQFGFVGAILPAALVVCMYLGFAIEGSVISGHALAAWAGIPFTLAVAIQVTLPAIVAIVGYRLIHFATRVVTVVSAILFAALTVALLGNLPGNLPSGTAVTPGNVLLVIAIYVGWQLTWAPYVSDYSRYLPEDTPSGRTFVWTYAGAALGSIWVMVLGAVAATVSAGAVASDAIGMLGDQIPGMGSLILIALLFGTIPAAAYGNYGMFLTAISAVSEKGHGRSTPMVRTAFILATGTLIVAVTLLSGGEIQHTVLNITLFLLNLLVPWTAINLADYYLVRQGEYEIDQLFDRRGSYGLVNWPAITAYVAAMAAQVPFINSGLYTGPLVDDLGGADVSWIVGLAVATILYLGQTKLARRAAPPAAPAPVDAPSEVA